MRKESNISQGESFEQTYTGWDSLPIKAVIMSLLIGLLGVSCGNASDPGVFHCHTHKFRPYRCGLSAYH